MNHLTQSDFVSALSNGIFYQGYIEGIGTACSDTIVVPSSSQPQPYNSPGNDKTIWYHNIEKLVIHPFKVVDPVSPEISNEDII